MVLAVCDHPHLRVIESCKGISSASFRSLARSKCWRNLNEIGLEVKYNVETSNLPNYEEDFYTGLKELSSNVGLKKYNLHGDIFCCDEDNDISDHVEKVTQLHADTIEELVIFSRESYMKSHHCIELCQNIRCQFNQHFKLTFFMCKSVLHSFSLLTIWLCYFL